MQYISKVNVLPYSTHPENAPAHERPSQGIIPQEIGHPEGGSFQQVRHIQAVVQAKQEAPETQNSFIKHLMTLSLDLRERVLQQVNTLEECNEIFEGIKEEAKRIQSLNQIALDKRLAIEQLKDLLTLLLRTCEIPKLDLRNTATLQSLDSIATFIEKPIPFEKVSEVITDLHTVQNVSQFFKADNTKVTLYVHNSLDPSAMSALKHFKTIAIQGISVWGDSLKTLKGIEVCESLTHLELVNVHLLTDFSSLQSLRWLTHLN